jgi:hypothetical protein
MLALLNTYWPWVISKSWYCRNPSFGLATKAKGGCKVAGQEERSPGVKAKGLARVWPRKARELRQEEARESHRILPGVLESVREWTLTFPRQLPLWEMDSRWTPKTSESDCKVKPQGLVTFFISLESSWSIDIQNGLAFLIWTSETQVMAKRRPGSRIPGSLPVLIPDH